jgi:threonine 3-dehydrogenase
MKLVTGGSGQVGAALTHILVKRGEQVVVFDVVKGPRLDDISDKITFVRGNLAIWSEVFNIVRDYKISHIYHMGAMLTSESEINPWASFQSNVVGTYNVLEAARLLNVEQIMFTSSIGTFGQAAGGEMSDTSLQRPRDFYGAGKLYCERLGALYRQKWGLDFRSIRYPSVLGPGPATPGHWDVPMIQAAMQGKPFACNSPADRPGPMLYVSDAARAADVVLQAPKDAIKMINYNVGGIAAGTPGELAAALKKHYPSWQVTFAPSGGPSGLRWNDSFARTEFGWKPEISTVELLVDAFIKDSTR